MVFAIYQVKIMKDHFPKLGILKLNFFDTTYFIIIIFLLEILFIIFKFKNWK